MKFCDYFVINLVLDIIFASYVFLKKNL